MVTPSRDDVARALWDTSDGQLLGLPWDACTGPRRRRFQRMANAVRAMYAPRCCESHGRLCEPPGDLCCNRCAEATHCYPDARLGEHHDGTVCVNPDLSPSGPPQGEYEEFVNQPRHLRATVRRPNGVTPHPPGPIDRA